MHEAPSVEQYVNQHDEQSSLILWEQISGHNNAISKFLNKLQVFDVRCTVHTNTTPTVITHSYALQKPPSCNDNGYKFEFKICRPNRHVSKIFCQKK